MRLLTDADRDALSALDRLTALAVLDLTHPDLVEELDAIAADTVEQLRLPIAMTNLFLDSAVLVKGSHGLDGADGPPGVPVEWSICLQAVRTGEPHLVRDLALDPEQEDNPLLAAAGVRSYAGAPLNTPDGQVLGTHCVLGTAPHDFTPDDLAVLTTAAAEVVTTLERYAHV